MLLDLGAGALVQGQALAAGRGKRTDGPLGNLEGARPAPSSRLELVEGRAEILDPIDEDRSVALKVLGQQDARRIVRQLDHRDPRPIPSTAKTRRAPRVRVKYSTSLAASRLGM